MELFFELFTNDIFEKTFVIFISDRSLGCQKWSKSCPRSFWTAPWRNRGDGGAPQILADQLTLSQPWGQIMSLRLQIAPPDF